MWTEPAAGVHGLSPRVRGNHRFPYRRLFSARSIPACAGEPSPFWRGWDDYQVYPRVCGGTAAGHRAGGPDGVYPRVCGGTELGMAVVLMMQGLSPRVRGNPPDQLERRAGRGSIPACAGEPVNAQTPCRICPVYPRVCGGTSMTPSICATVLGLSPRVRGNRGHRPPPTGSRGSIPACAGEPRSAACHQSLGSVYPRVCGGTWSAAFWLCSARGLSPRVRGNRERAAGWGTGLRSIPACAGEPTRFHLLRPRREVYPRVCGGTPSIQFYLPFCSGLSPRVRGNRPLPLPPAYRFRSIPACAGEPSSRIRCYPPPGVYPRVCGGTRQQHRTHPEPDGLSPRVRGNRLSSPTLPEA